MEWLHQGVLEVWNPGQSKQVMFQERPELAEGRSFSDFVRLLSMVFGVVSKKDNLGTRHIKEIFPVTLLCMMIQWSTE